MVSPHAESCMSVFPVLPAIPPPLELALLVSVSGSSWLLTSWEKRVGVPPAVLQAGGALLPLLSALQRHSG